MIHDTIRQHDARTPTAEALLASGGLISVQVLNELAAVARRKLRMAWPPRMKRVLPIAI